MVLRKTDSTHCTCISCMTSNCCAVPEGSSADSDVLIADSVAPVPYPHFPVSGTPIGRLGMLLHRNAVVSGHSYPSHYHLFSYGVKLRCQVNDKAVHLIGGPERMLRPRPTRSHWHARGTGRTLIFNSQRRTKLPHNNSVIRRRLHGKPLYGK